MSTTHYTAPQTIHPLGVGFAVLAALAGALVVAPLYAYAIVYIPIIYVNIVLTIAFGALVGGAVAGALRRGHTHNLAFSFLAVTAAAGFAYWLHWIWWFSALAFRNDMPDFHELELLFPPFLFENLAGVLEYGTWSMKSGDPVTGGFLLFIWVAEAVLFFGGAFGTAAVLIGAGTYCGRCQKWCDAITPWRVQAEPTGEMVRRANAQDWSMLRQPEPSPAAAYWYEIGAAKCPSCGETCTLSVEEVKVSVDKKGNSQQHKKTVVDRVYIARQDLDALESAPRPGVGQVSA